jgi:hypothetical protein
VRFIILSGARTHPTAIAANHLPVLAPEHVYQGKDTVNRTLASNLARSESCHPSSSLRDHFTTKLLQSIIVILKPQHSCEKFG